MVQRPSFRVGVGLQQDKGGARKGSAVIGAQKRSGHSPELLLVSHLGRRRLWVSGGRGAWCRGLPAPHVGKLVSRRTRPGGPSSINRLLHPGSFSRAAFALVGQWESPSGTLRLLSLVEHPGICRKPRDCPHHAGAEAVLCVRLVFQAV